MDPRQYNFLPGQFPGYGYVRNPPGAPTMGRFSTPSTFPQYPTSTPGPPLTPNGPNYPTTAHYYPQRYTIIPPQPFTMPGQFPLSPNFNAVPISQQRVPIHGMDPYQRVAMAEHFAKSVKDATASTPSNVTEPSSAPENLNPDVYTSEQQNSFKDPVTASIISPQNITAKQPPSSTQRVSVNIPKDHSHPPSSPRGVRSLAGQDSSKWLEHVQNIIQYRFHDPDILEEALESPGSGVTCVGNTHRNLGRGGNKRLAAVGTRAMELVLMSECYYVGTRESRSMMLSSRLTVPLRKLGWSNFWLDRRCARSDCECHF
jgi:hypothetical protein